MLVSLLFIFVAVLFLQNQKANAVSLTTGLLARISCSHAVTWPQSGQGTLALLQTTAGWSYPRSGPREGPKDKLSIHMGKHRIQGRFEGVTTGFCEPSFWALPLAGWFPDSATLLGSDFWESIWLAIGHWVACGLVPSGLVICCQVGW